MCTNSGCLMPSARVEEQLKAIALQFSTVNRVSIFINGEYLEKLLDSRG
jgi:hypothetical protein